MHDSFPGPLPDPALPERALPAAVSEVSEVADVSMEAVVSVEAVVSGEVVISGGAGAAVSGGGGGGGGVPRVILPGYGNRELPAAWLASLPRCGNVDWLALTEEKHLSPRQSQVILGIFTGRTLSQIADELNLSEETIRKDYWVEGRTRLGAKKRLDAIHSIWEWAVERRLILERAKWEEEVKARIPPEESTEA